MAAGQTTGEVWAVAAPGAAGPVDVRVFVQGITNFNYTLGSVPKRLLPDGVPLSALIIQNLGAVPIELGNDSGLVYGQGLRIAPNSILSNGSISPGGPGSAVIESYARANLPAAGNKGRIVELLDYDRGLWLDDGTQWRSITGRVFDVTAFGAKADGGVTDNGVAFNLARAALVAAGGGRLVVPPGDNFYGFTTLWNCDDINVGMFVEGTSMGANSGGRPELRWLGAAGSGSLMRLNSSHGLRVTGLKFTYSNALYDGWLVSMDWSAAVADPTLIHFLDCEFAGVGAVLAAALLRMNHTIISEVRDCHFVNALVGILLGDGSYANVIQIENCAFNTCSTSPIYQNGTAEAITVSGNTFEPRADGTGRAYRAGAGIFVFGLQWVGNWHGDVSVNGGGGWVEALVTGASFLCNRFSTPGAGAADVCIRLLGGCTSVTIMANRFEGPNNLDYGASVLGLFVGGNMFSGLILNEGNAGTGEYARIGNNGPVANQQRMHGTMFDFLAPINALMLGVGYLAAFPAAGSLAAIVAIADAAMGYGSGALLLSPSDGSGANVPTVIFSGNPRTDQVKVGASTQLHNKLYPATDALAYQAAAGIMAGTGAPNNANGANGDFYFNSAGGAGTSVYMKRAGAWVGIL